MSETRENQIKRLKMRSMRRGIKEMDILLSAYAEAALEAMSAEKIALYDQLLHENDQDLYQWVTGQIAPPASYDALLHEIAQTHQKD